MSAARPGRAGRVLHTGQAVVDVALRIPSMPEPGGDVFASRHELAAGGGVNVMAAAARDGAEVVYLGSHGTGPFGDLVREALAADGVKALTAPDLDQDTGFSIALVDDTAERTFVSTSGAEARTTVAQLRGAGAAPGDVVYVSGYSLVHPMNREALLEWVPALPGEVQVVVDPAPVIDQVDLPAVRTLISRADVWTTNEREARILLGRLGGGGPAAAAYTMDELAARLYTVTGRSIVLRAGGYGCVLCRPGAPPVTIPAPAVEAVDTNGAGDAHTGVLCSRLAAGVDLGEALTHAGVAAAIAVTRHGPATAPMREETEAEVARSPRSRITR